MRRLIAGHRLIGPGPGDPWQELAVAVLLRASLRLRRDPLTDPEAVTWLQGPGDELAHALGWPAGVLRDYPPATVWPGDYDPARVDWRAVSPCPTGHLIWPEGVGLRLAASAAYNTVAVRVRRTCNGVASAQRDKGIWPRVHRFPGRMKELESVSGGRERVGGGVTWVGGSVVSAGGVVDRSGLLRIVSESD